MVRRVGTTSAKWQTSRHMTEAEASTVFEEFIFLFRKLVAFQILFIQQQMIVWMDHVSN